MVLVLFVAFGTSQWILRFCYVHAGSSASQMMTRAPTAAAARQRTSNAIRAASDDELHRGRLQNVLA
jgi:hypothetical protein